VNFEIIIGLIPVILPIGSNWRIIDFCTD
jgi:hypothetical protein